MSVQATPEVRYERRQAVVRLTIDRPAVRNALALGTLAELEDALARASAEAGVRAIVLTGAGERAFASGADLGELPEAMADAKSAMAYDVKVGALYDALAACPMPVIARLQGHAIGGGCLLALACDLRIAAEPIFLSLPAARIGLMLSPQEHRLAVRQMGLSRARLLLYSGRRLSAAQALDWGLVDEVVPAGELNRAVDALAGEIARGAPLALAAAKQLTGGAGPEAAAAWYRRIYGSRDLAEGLAAVEARRAPRFEGR